MNTANLLRERTDSLKLTKDLQVLHNKALPIKEILRIALDKICLHMAWPVGHVYMYNPKKKILTTSDLWHPKSKNKFTTFKNITKKTDFIIGVGLPGSVLSKKKDIWIKDVQKDKNFPRADSCMNIGVHGGFAMPILVRGEVFAVLEFFSTKVLNPDLEMMDTMSHIATSVGIVIERKLADEKLEKTKELLEKDFQKRTKDLKEREEHLTVCWQGSREGSWDVDLKTNKVIYSDRWKQMLGYKPEEITDSFEEWSSRVHPKDYPRITKIFTNHLEKKGDYKSEYRIKNKAGEWRWFQCSGQALWDEEGVPYRIAGAAVDVNDTKLAVEALKIATQKAEDFSEAKSNFMANMSHEIRTPMNGIIGMTNLLVNSDLNKQQREYANLILDSSANLMQIINNILDISKIEAKKIELDNFDFNLRETTQEVISLMAASCKGKNIDIKLSYPKKIPTYIVGDQGRIRQILFNLINNAIKFTEDGNIDVIFAVKKQQGNKIIFKISVKDKGIGIEKDKFETIFQKFHQSDIGTTRQYGGTGLGLAICKELVKLMDGEIGVSSIKNKGSTFWFTINLGLSKNQQSSIVNEKKKENYYTLPPILNNTNILLVEDNSVSQKLMTLILERYGCSITPASNGREAVEQVRKQKFDAILMDCQMPEMDGYKSTKEIRKLERKNKKSTNVIIAITANALKGDKEKCLDAGMDDYLAKPVSISDLEKILKKWITQKKVYKGAEAEDLPLKKIA